MSHEVKPIDYDDDVLMFYVQDPLKMNGVL